MKIIENKQIILSDVFYFIKNDTRKFDTIELINEFGLDSKEEYIEFIYNEIRLNVPKKYYSYLLISIHSNNKNTKLINMKFEREINNIDIKEFEMLKIISDMLNGTTKKVFELMFGEPIGLLIDLIRKNI